MRELFIAGLAGLTGFAAGKLPVPDRKRPRGITRRDALIGGIGVLGGLAIERVLENLPWNQALQVIAQSWLSGLPQERIPRLEEALGRSTGQVREVIKTHFNQPFQQLSDFEKITLDAKVSTTFFDQRTRPMEILDSSIALDLIDWEGPHIPKNLRWRMKGIIEGGLGRHLYLGAYAAFEADQRLSRLILGTNLQHTFGTGLTPGVDRYIDTTRGARIAEQDLESVAYTILRPPTGIRWQYVTNNREDIFLHPIFSFLTQGISWQTFSPGEVISAKFSSGNNEVKYTVTNRGGVVLTITAPFYTPRNFF